MGNLNWSPGLPLWDFTLWNSRGRPVTWQCSTSSGRTWITDLRPPWAPKRSSSSIASSAAYKHRYKLLLFFLIYITDTPFSLSKLEHMFSQRQWKKLKFSQSPIVIFCLPFQWIRAFLYIAAHSRNKKENNRKTLPKMKLVFYQKWNTNKYITLSLCGTKFLTAFISPTLAVNFYH
jgi:hypothetical protein